jgi:hypothetical protein
MSKEREPLLCDIVISARYDQPDGEFNVDYAIGAIWARDYYERLIIEGKLSRYIFDTRGSKEKPLLLR